jgi:hypothetical protein
MENLAGIRTIEYFDGFYEGCLGIEILLGIWFEDLKGLTGCFEEGSWRVCD